MADVFSVRLSCRRDVRASPLPPIQLLAASETRRDRTGRALTSSHPPQNAIKYEETHSLCLLFLQSPSLLEPGDGPIKVTPAGTVSARSAHPPSRHRTSLSFCSDGSRAVIPPQAEDFRAALSSFSDVRLPTTFSRQLGVSWLGL